MPNIAALLKLEIARVARKEIRAELESLRKAVTTQKASITELKRANQGLQQQLRRLEKSQRKPVAEEQTSDAKKMRFSAKGFASLRQRLGLSANSMGALLGVSGQSIYKWETGEAAPRARYLSSIAALRGVGKKEVAKRLEELNAS